MSDDAVILLAKICERRGMVKEIIELSGKYKLDAAAKARLSSGIIAAIDDNAKRGRLNTIAGLINSGLLSGEAGKRIEEALIAALKYCEKDEALGLSGFIGMVEKISALSPTAKKEAYKSIKESLKLCEKDGTGLHAAVRLMNMEDIDQDIKNQAVQSIIGGITKWGEKGWIHNLSELLNDKDVSSQPNLKAQVEESLIAAIKQWEAKGQYIELTDLLERTDLSDAVKTERDNAIIDAIRLWKKGKSFWDIRWISEKRGLSDAIKNSLIEAETYL